MMEGAYKYSTCTMLQEKVLVHSFAVQVYGFERRGPVSGGYISLHYCKLSQYKRFVFIPILIRRLVNCTNEPYAIAAWFLSLYKQFPLFGALNLVHYV
jgi:hypothetical protein